eukprot:4870514-Pyramimonas_sp.AAC.1
MGARPGGSKAPQSEIIVHDHQTVHYELMLISRDRESDLKEFHLTEQFYDTDKWYDSLKGRAAGRDWVINMMRLDRSPLITREHCLRMAIECLAPRRLHTTSLENVSCTALSDWRKATVSEYESCSMLEIAFLLPERVHDRITLVQWETYSHASDIRKLYALLNA